MQPKKKKKTKNTNSKDTCTLILTTALFTIAKLGKQPKWPSTDEWVRKMWHAHMSVCMCVCVCFNGIIAAAAKSLQSCLTLCDPVDCSLPGFSIHGIFRGTLLEWGATAFSQWNYHSARKKPELLLFTTTQMGSRGYYAKWNKSD